MISDVAGRTVDPTSLGYESPDGVFSELNPRITCPDGTYHRIDAADLGARDTTCRSGASPS